MTINPLGNHPKLNKLAKWRSLFVGRILGTRSIDDPQAQGMRDLFDKVVVQRAEMSALTKILFSKGLTSPSKLYNAIEEEAEILDKMYEKVFPGIRTNDEGLEIYDTELAAKTMEGWPE